MPWACPAAAHRCNPQRSRRARGPCRRSLARARAAGAPGGGHRGRGRPGTGRGGRAGAAVRRARGGRAAAAGGGGPGPGRASRPVRAASVRPAAAAWCRGAWLRRRREGTRAALRRPSRGRAGLRGLGLPPPPLSQAPPSRHPLLRPRGPAARRAPATQHPAGGAAPRQRRHLRAPAPTAGHLWCPVRQRRRKEGEARLGRGAGQRRLEGAP